MALHVHVPRHLQYVIVYDVVRCAVLVSLLTQCYDECCCGSTVDLAAHGFRWLVSLCFFIWRVELCLIRPCNMQQWKRKCNIVVLMLAADARPDVTSHVTVTAG
jgi:hypothetical protein